MSKRRSRAVLIAGPTASGKSALAVALAQRCGGVVINADSMQVYRDLRVLTARPSKDDEALVPHALYGHVAASEPYSVARWLSDVAQALGEAGAAGRRPIIVGGTGLYFKAMLEGLSPIPAIPDEVRARWRRVATEILPRGLHEMLAERDPVMAARLAPGDTQRATRALEVIEATGRSLADWQAEKGVPILLQADTVRIVVRPPREALHERCDRRFEQMVAEGALEEVRELRHLELSGEAPAMRALGVPALAAHLAGEISLEAAVARGQMETRQYVKRQETWLNRNMNAWEPIDEIINCEISHRYVQLIDD